MALSTITQEILRELDALSLLPEHPRVVRFAGCAFTMFAGVQLPSWILMEHVSGGNLKQLIHPGHGSPSVPMALERISRAVSEVAEALCFIHSHGLIHRDVKPANILIDATGGCKVSTAVVT